MFSFNKKNITEYASVHCNAIKIYDLTNSMGQRPLGTDILGHS